jgi:D-alanyl-lipoteichoic acid acyltransferase DltB (MBOAT superfamily)
VVFNSLEFGFFFAIVATAFFVVPHRWRWALLLAASYVFYMWWNASYALLIALSTLVDFFAGRAIHRSESPRSRKLALLVSLCSNLGILFTFKYWTFFHDAVGAALSVVGVEYGAPELSLLLPVGISFYTFQTMSYTIDIYRSAMAPEPHLGRFALYVSFFPQLVAGPIERAARLIPQLRERKDFDYERVSSGLQLMAWGLFKKVVVGDRLGIYVDAVYNNAGDHSGLTFWIATYAFAFQIYCDFSGYSDMAIGAARVLGYDLMRNFDRPYFSRTITEFWRRWHISLSTWLRDYLYISLGGNRGGVWNTYRNLMITMVLGGLWHGASWNFITWGTLQGVFLMFSRITLPARDAFWAAVRAPKTLVTLLRVFVTFHLVCFSWVFFRAATFGDALAILKGGLTGFGMPFIHVQSMAHGFVGVVILLCVQLVQERYGSVRKLISGLPTPVRWALWYGLILATITLGIESGAQFIYFQF